MYVRYETFMLSIIRRCSGKSGKDAAKTEVKAIVEDILREYPEAPTTCCMTGCANCVWLDYAEKLCEFYKDGGDKALKEIEDQISDNNLKAFLLHEIRMRNKER